MYYSAYRIQIRILPSLAVPELLLKTPGVETGACASIKLRKLFWLEDFVISARMIYRFLAALVY